MKRTFTLLTMLLSIFIVVSAQTSNHTLVFVDLEGNELADGATLYATEKESYAEFGDFWLMKHYLAVKNKGTQDVVAMVKGTVEEKQGYGFFICYPEDCEEMEQIGDFSTKGEMVAAGQVGTNGVQAQFMYERTGRGTVSLQLYTANQVGEDFTPLVPQSKVTIIYNHETTGIALLGATVDARYNVFNIQGMLVRGNVANLENLQKGIYVVQTLQKGKVVSTKKYIVK